MEWVTQEIKARLLELETVEKEPDINEICAICEYRFGNHRGDNKKCPKSDTVFTPKPRIKPYVKDVEIFKDWVNNVYLKSKNRLIWLGWCLVGGK